MDKFFIELVRRSKKALSEARGIMYSCAGLFEMCIESKAIGRVPVTHESAGELSKDAKMGILGSTSHIRIRVVVVFVSLTKVSLSPSLLTINLRRGTKFPRSLSTSYDSLRPGFVVV